MKRVALVGALALVTTVGCTRDARRADVDAQPGDLLIFAVTNPEGEIVEVQSSVAPNAAGLAFGEAHTLHSFVIGRADLVDASGELVDASTIRADRGERPGACGRCLAPPVVGPMVVHPGASCRVPSFAAAARFEAIDGRAIRREDLEATQAVRDAVFVTMDGDCPCTRVTPELSVPAEVCPILPSAAPIRAERVALFEDGAVVGVNKGFAFRVEPDGAVRTTSFRPATGNVQTIGLLSDGTTIVASTDRSLLTKSMIAATYGPNLERRELRDPPPVEPDQLVRLDGDETIYLLGERFSTLTEEPGVTACRVVDDRLDCTDQGVVFDAPRCPRITSGKLLGAFGLPGGGHVALANRGHVFYRPAGAREWYCDPESDDVFIDTSNGRRTIKDLLGFAVRGDVAMACVSTESPVDEVLRPAIVRYRFPTLAPMVDPGAAGFELTLVSEDLFDGFCRDVVLLPEGGFRAFEQGALGAVDVDVDGNVTARYALVGRPGAELWPQIPEPVVSARTSSSGYTLAISMAGRLYRRAPGGAFLPIVADVPPNPFRARAFVVRGDEAWAFLGNGGSPLRIRLNGNGCSGLEVDAVPFSERLTDVGERIDVAMVGRAPTEAVLIAHVGGRLQRLDVDLETSTLLDRRDLGVSQASYRSGVSVTPGRFILVREDGIVQRLDDDGLTDVEPTRDDPTTAGIEAPVEVDRGRRRWSTVRAAQGVAWVAGFGAMGRVTIGPNRTGFETFWLERLSNGAFAEVRRSRPPDFTAAHAYCPDDLLLLASERIFINELTQPKARVRAWTTVPGLVAIETYPWFGFTQVEAPTGAAEPAAIAAAGGQTALMFGDAIVYRDGTTRTVAPFSDIQAAVRAPGFALIGGGAGRVAAVVDIP